MQPEPNRRPLFLSLCLVSLALACQPSPSEESAPIAGLPLLPGTETALASIDREILHSTVSHLASNELGGRGPASAGDRMTQEHLASVLEDLGYQPGGPEGSWYQPFDIVGIDATVPEAWSFHGHDKTLELKFWDDFIASSGVQAERASFEGAEIVFVGYGIEASEYEWNDYQDDDLAGKVFLMINNDPDWDEQLFQGNRRLYYGRWDYKYEIAAKKGAVATIIIHTTPSAGYPFQVVQTSWTGPQFELPAEDEPRSQVEAWVTEDSARRLVAMAGMELEPLVESAKSRDFRPVHLGIETSLTLTNEISLVQTGNVAGLLEGSDPELKDEVVVLTAHHDHLGIGKPDATGDDIYNGALDNAAGVAQVVAVARALGGLPQAPRRSVLVLFVAAEEQGLLGSEYYAQHPTFPSGKIAANVNLDGGNIWGRTRDLTYIGYGKSTLDAVVEAAAATQSRTVKGDQFPDKGFFYRSDQFNFAKVGVPAIYVDTGTDFVGRPAGWGQEQIEAWEAEKYHQPGDELEDSWNFDGMIDDARIALLCVLSIAEADEMPAWNAGDEFEAARLASLQAD